MSRTQLPRALDEPVSLVAHDPRWADAFERERARLIAQFGGRFVEVRHFGSTAVPGLVAKPVIDIIAGLESMAVVEALIPDLCDFGYFFHEAGNLPFSDRRWLFRERDGHRTHHLHLVVHEGSAWRDRVMFCERLKANAQLRSQYESLKRDLVSRFGHDRGRYSELKQAFILAAIREV